MKADPKVWVEDIPSDDDGERVTLRDEDGERILPRSKGLRFLHDPNLCAKLTGDSNHLGATLVRRFLEFYVPQQKTNFVPRTSSASDYLRTIDRQNPPRLKRKKLPRPGGVVTETQLSNASPLRRHPSRSSSRPRPR